MSSIDIEVNDQEKYLKSSFITYRSRCKEDNEGNNDKSISKPLESSSFTVGRPFHYPLERYCKTFQIQYNQKLTNTAKFVLSSFKNKYIYYAVDDLLFLKNLNYTEKENLLGFLYSPILSLHNDLSINLFDIWIDEIYINEDILVKLKSEIEETKLSKQLQLHAQNMSRKIEELYQLFVTEKDAFLMRTGQTILGIGYQPLIILMIKLVLNLLLKHLLIIK